MRNLSIEVIKNRHKIKALNNFLSGFNRDILREVVKYYQLPCEDLRKNQCLKKAIRKNLNRKKVWTAVIDKFFYQQSDYSDF